MYVWVFRIKFAFNKEDNTVYPYHNKIKQRIRNGELVRIEKGEGEYALVFVFSTPPFIRPVKYSALWRYEKILDKIYPFIE